MIYSESWMGIFFSDLHGVVEELMLELFDTENLLKEVVKLFLVEHLVAQHGRGRPLARPSRFFL